MHLWDRLIDQATITLNILRTSTINNRLSAYAQLHGAFNFMATPLGPPGTKVIIHEKPTIRGTWAPHGVEGWYLGPAMDHYRSYHVYVPSTNSTRIADTLAWFPSHVVMPTASSTDIAMAAAYDLTQALLHPSPASALSPLTDSQKNALKELASIFGTIVSTPTQPQDLPIPIISTSILPNTHPPQITPSTDLLSSQSPIDTRTDIVPRVDPAVVPIVDPDVIPRVDPNIVPRVDPDTFPRVDAHTVVRTLFNYRGRTS